MAEPGFSAQIVDLQRRLARAREGGGEAVELEILMQDLETAVEELRVADDEVRTQQQEVTRLLEDQELMRWRHERMLSVLPIPVLTTDYSGRLKSLNAACSALLGIRVDHVLRKPIFSYVAESDRLAMRTALGEALRRRGTRRQPTTLELRGRSVPVTVYIAPSPQASDEATWLLLEGRRPGDAEHLDQDAGPLPDALLTLFTLAGRGLEARDILQEAAYITGEALGPGAEVSLVLGPPLDPEAAASTSLDAQVVDRWQLEAGSGPTVSGYESGGTVVTGNLRGDPRWSALGTGASSLSSAVVVPLGHADGLHGVLSVYLREEGRPPANLVETVEILAAAITSVLQEMGLRAHLETLASDMRTALASRSLIEQAKGIVMAAKHCSADEAFQHLVMLSNTGHLKLRDVAGQIVEGASR
jgi:PAS domain-containing protein